MARCIAKNMDVDATEKKSQQHQAQQQPRPLQPQHQPAHHPTTDHPPPPLQDANIPTPPSPPSHPQAITPSSLRSSRKKPLHHLTTPSSCKSVKTFKTAKSKDTSAWQTFATEDSIVHAHTVKSASAKISVKDDSPSGMNGASEKEETPAVKVSGRKASSASRRSGTRGGKHRGNSRTNKIARGTGGENEMVLDMVGRDIIFESTPKTKRTGSSISLSSALSDLLLAGMPDEAGKCGHTCKGEANELISLANTSVSSITESSSVFFDDMSSTPSGLSIGSFLNDAALHVYEKMMACGDNCDIGPSKTTQTKEINERVSSVLPGDVVKEKK